MPTPNRAAARQSATKEAKRILARPDGVIILDTETTGYSGEIIELGIIDLAGNILYDGRFKPSELINISATRAHGITADMLADCPLWADQWPIIGDILAAARIVLIYNAFFDARRIEHTCRKYSLPAPSFKSHCLMVQYAHFFGAWNPRRRAYDWQPLNGGHGGIADCRAALARLQEMAAAGLNIPVSST